MWLLPRQIAGTMTVPVDSDAGRTSSSDRLLRIANLLDLPAEAFLRPADKQTRSLVQASELLTAFHAIIDPPTRDRCLAFVRAQVEVAHTTQALDQVSSRWRQAASLGRQLERQRRVIRAQRRKLLLMPSLHRRRMGSWPFPLA